VGINYDWEDNIISKETGPKNIFKKHVFLVPSKTIRIQSHCFVEEI
jgi:hypothetical protein